MIEVIKKVEEENFVKVISNNAPMCKD